MNTKNIVLVLIFCCTNVKSKPGIGLGVVGGIHGINALGIGHKQHALLPHSHVEIQQTPVAYDFKWLVKDNLFGNDFGHQESRDGYDTAGSYYVLLPDGRTQNVKYFVNGKSGFVADVSYDGVGLYPSHSHLEPVIAKSDQVDHYVKPLQALGSNPAATVVKKYEAKPKRKHQEKSKLNKHQNEFQTQAKTQASIPIFQNGGNSFGNPIARAGEVVEVHQPRERFNLNRSLEPRKQPTYYQKVYTDDLLN